MSVQHPPSKTAATMSGRDRTTLSDIMNVEAFVDSADHLTIDNLAKVDRASRNVLMPLLQYVKLPRCTAKGEPSARANNRTMQKLHAMRQRMHTTKTSCARRR